MQSELIDLVFGDFQKQFRHFFNLCEKGFTNELIINMYARIYQRGETLVDYRSKFNEIYFIFSGGISLFNKHRVTDFLLLPQYSFFGDYQLLYDLRSNIVFRTSQKFSKTKCMCVKRSVFIKLCEQFPHTAENLKMRSLERRSYFLHKMQQLDIQNNTALPVKRLHSSVKKKYLKGLSTEKGDMLKELEELHK